MSGKQSYKEHAPISVVCLVGVSGSGKSTLRDEMARIDPRIHLAVGCTTRAPRPGEVDGVDYHFLSREEFAEKINNEELVEHASFAGNNYGLMWSELAKPGKVVACISENEGAKNLKREAGARIVAVLCPSVEEWVRRLTDRGDDPDDVLRRIEADKERLAEIRKMADFEVINDDLVEATYRLRGFALKQLEINPSRLSL